MELVKRIATLCMAVVFFTLSTSFSYYKSFCEDGCQSNISLIESFDNCCKSKSENLKDSCHQEDVHEDDCCGVEEVVIKYDGDYDFSSQEKFVFSSLWILKHQSYFSFNSNLVSTAIQVNNYRGPPKISKPGRMVLLQKSVLVI